MTYLVLYLTIAIAVALAALVLLSALPAGSCQAQLCGPMQHVWRVV